MTARNTREDSPDPAPPEASDPGRALRFRPIQLATLALLVAIIGTALAGAYNQRERTTTVTIGGMSIDVRYTTRTRFQQTQIISVLARNPTPSGIDSLHVSVDTAYLSGFSQVTMIPDPEFPFATSLAAIPAGGIREVHVAARGDRAGRHRGNVLLSLRGDTVRVPLSTFILP